MGSVMKTKIWHYALGAAGLLQQLYYYPLLPEKTAIHFNVYGIADSWSGKQYFALFNVLLFLFMTGIIPLSDFLTRRAPDSRFNLPNKAWWLAPERREETLTVIAVELYRFGSAFLLFLLATVQLVIRANLDGSGRLSYWFYPLLGLFFVFTVVWVIRFYRRFSKRAIGGK